MRSEERDESTPILHGEPLAGVVVQRLQTHVDERGSFTDVFDRRWPFAIDARQWSVVGSKANVLRGPHLHLGHDEYFMLIQGKAWIGLRDIRRDSVTRDRSCLIELHARAPAALFFPRGIIHGWYFPEESTHLQSVTECYADYHPGDNLGCRWDDPELEIAWPCVAPILSERAAAFPPLSELLDRVHATGAR